MSKRHLISCVGATLLLSATTLGITAAPAFALPHATGNITCTMVTSSTSVGSITKGLSTGGPFYGHVTVQFVASFTCAAPAPAVTTPAGVVVTGGTLKGKAVYTSPATGAPANQCGDFNTGLDVLTAAVVTLHWTASSPIAPTGIVYTGVGPNTVSVPTITLATPPGVGTLVGSFAGVGPPDTVKLATTLIAACPAATPAHTTFAITGGTIHV